ncbi:DNA recombination protein RmuC [Paracoccus alcaliphilus]|uniref:DNA recombination protein RmuC homolog n=1 Tax=Paracoccus alcaliphilus TaxID=34002 RepID=A0A1H8M7K6_9RHOB|nr:DNA recombination protein RmuC [Paracoccus alcaliphilus]WCR16986.1 DNA recombination protein RmuC [Paracoccus alcaliphilus]SEO13274.1 DNA recombination protein RmuC [Paracoccus alcaliphilus]
MPQAIETALNDLPTLRILLAVLAVIAIGAVLLLVQRGRDLAVARGQNSDLQSRLTRLDEQARSQDLRIGQQEIRQEHQAARLAELTEERDGLTDALHQSRQEIARAERALAELRLGAQKDREAAEREIATLRELREEMSGQFKLMAAETLRLQGADMQKVQSEQLSALLTPFRDQVHRFQTELQARNKVLDEEGARLREQITFLHQRSEDISREAVNLTRALKGEKQRQGAWGEMVLERILETSGLEAGTHYETQASWRDEEGKLWRPDVVVKMPRDKIMVVDSKVSLNDYELSVNAEDAAERDAALRRHVAAMRNHITTLSDKGYHRMDDNSVDYVLMFIPIEGAFSEALRADPGLAGFALERGVGLTTPTTLMLTLRTVEHIWAVERRESNAMEIARRAGALYDKVAGFVDSMEAVGRALDQASRSHGQAMDRLTRGSGNVIRQVEMLRELGARTQKKIGLDHDGGALPGIEGPEAAE